MISSTKIISKDDLGKCISSNGSGKEKAAEVAQVAKVIRTVLLANIESGREDRVREVCRNADRGQLWS